MRVIVEGEYAMYTKPELKVERVSYAVPTVSAITGMLEAIYRKPEMCYVIDRIVVFNEIKYETMCKNEVKEKLSLSKVEEAMPNGTPVVLDIVKLRTQRSNMFLRDVKYGIEFHIELTGRGTHADDTVEKHRSIFCRRVMKGQHFEQPYLGRKCCPISRIYLTDNFDYNAVSPSLHGTTYVGRMLYKNFYKDGGKPINDVEKDKIKIFSDEVDSVYYTPVMYNGVIEVPRITRDIIKQYNLERC